MKLSNSVIYWTNVSVRIFNKKSVDCNVLPDRLSR